MSGASDGGPDGEPDDNVLKGLMGDVAMVRFASLVASFYKGLVANGVPEDAALGLTHYMVRRIVGQMKSEAKP